MGTNAARERRDLVLGGFVAGASGGSGCNVCGKRRWRMWWNETMTDCGMESEVWCRACAYDYLHMYDDHEEDDGG